MQVQRLCFEEVCRNQTEAAVTPRLLNQAYPAIRAHRAAQGLPPHIHARLENTLDAIIYEAIYATAALSPINRRGRSTLEINVQLTYAQLIRALKQYADLSNYFSAMFMTTGSGYSSLHNDRYISHFFAFVWSAPKSRFGRSNGQGDAGARLKIEISCGLNPFSGWCKQRGAPQAAPWSAPHEREILADVSIDMQTAVSKRD